MFNLLPFCRLQIVYDKIHKTSVSIAKQPIAKVPDMSPGGNQIRF